MDIHKKRHIFCVVYHPITVNNEKTALNFTVISVRKWIFTVLFGGLKVWDKSNNFDWISELLWTVYLGECWLANSSYTVHEWYDVAPNVQQHLPKKWRPPSILKYAVLHDKIRLFLELSVYFGANTVVLLRKYKIWVVEDENGVTESDQRSSGGIFLAVHQPL